MGSGQDRYSDRSGRHAAASHGRRRLSVVECGDLDPEQVAQAARQALPQANAMGWVTATVTEASRRLTRRP